MRETHEFLAAAREARERGAAHRADGFARFAIGTAAMALSIRTGVSRSATRATRTITAAGLALFAVTGASKALAHGLNPVMAIVLGMVTGIGGGMVRDVLLAEIPTVLRAELYAVAALAAAAIVVVGHMLQLPDAPVIAVAPNCAREDADCRASTPPVKNPVRRTMGTDPIPIESAWTTRSAK